jgi:hypothetical protein
MAKEADYSPTGWLVSWFDQVRLDPERAQKFNDLRERLCQQLGKDNQACQVNNLWMKALDLLIANEAALLTTVDHFDAEGNKLD